MKKLIAIAVVFALAAGGAFAADIGVNVIGTVSLFGSDTSTGSTIDGAGGFDRIRFEGAGENEGGNFGAWARIDAIHWSGTVQWNALAWWKPIDQVKLTLGGNPDGIFGKEGTAGWMFHQIVADTGIVSASQAWGCDYTIKAFDWMGFMEAYDKLDAIVGDPTADDIKAFEKGSFGAEAVFRNAFYGGFAGNGLLLEVKPVDMFGLNIVLPYWMGGKSSGGGLVKSIFQHMTIQADINLDFGNIALTYELIDNDMNSDKIGHKAYLYFGLSAIENLSLDVGIGFRFPENDGSVFKMTRTYPLSIGIAAKYNINDSFGLKARLMAEFLGSLKDWSGDKLNDPFQLIFEVLPFFSINDSITIYADLGLNLVGPAKYDGDTYSATGVGFHFNPYVGIGSEWGPTFFVGFKLWTTPSWGVATSGDTLFTTNKAVINWAVPIALHVSF